MTAEQQAMRDQRSLAGTAQGAGLAGSLPGTTELVSVLVMSLFVLPPFALRLFGRGGDVYPLELVLLFLMPIIFWHHNLRLVRQPTVTALAIYLLCCLPSWMNATDKPRWIYGMLLFGVTLSLLWCLVAARPRIRQLDRLLVWSPLPFVVLAAVIIGHQLVNGAFFFAAQKKIQIGYGGSNFLASTLLIGAFVPLSVALAGRNVEQKISGLVSFGVIALGIVMTGSRMGLGLLPMGIGLSVLIHMRTQGRRMIMPLVALGLILLIVLVLITPYLQSLESRGRFHDILQQRNLLTRLVLFDLYFEAFLEEPIIGIGMFNGRVSPVLAVMGEGQSEGWGANQNAHNWILQCLADTGIVGMIGFAIFLIAAFRCYLFGVVRRSNPWQPISVGFLVGFIIITLHGLLEPNFHGKPFIYFLMLTLGLAEQIRRVVSAHDEAQAREAGITRRRRARWWRRILTGPSSAAVDARS